MRFFTPEWHEADLPQAETDAVFSAYERHLNAIWPRLHATVRVLAGGLNLQNALIRRVVLDRTARELRLELRAGDEEAGFYDVDLTYLGAIVDAADVALLAEAARDPDTELLYDELDLSGGAGGAEAYLHRLLFWPYRECEVLFDALALRLAPRGDLDVPVLFDRFVEVGQQAG
ncbi:MAG TPA: hypothetical protein VFS40_08115 [Gemmatimonadales bacterium]|nr:hypothetical protein [Gemmatimonadales bacterium]